MKKYVIIGNGAAAVNCVEGIRSLDREGEITLVSEEKYATYCRPLISYYLEGKTDTERMRYRPQDFYEKNGCSVLYGRRAVRLDAQKKLVELEDGTALSYDALCVASGSHPFVPPTEGLEKVKKRFCFLTLEDALALERAITPESRVLIVGAGLIGLKCAEGLHGRVASLTVCDLADRVLPSILDEEGAALVQKKLEEHGISLRLADPVVRYEADAAFLKSGVRIPFDILVTAVGVRPNAALVTGAGGAGSRGIAVDTRMRTSLAEVYAAGDCTESTDISDGNVKIMALLPNAVMQGFCAGVNMAGGSSVFDCAVPMNAIGFFGLHVMTAGSRPSLSDGAEVYEEHTDNSLKKLFIRDNRLVGFELVGQTERAGIYTSLLRNGTPLDSLDFERLKKVPDLSAFRAENRRKMLRGMV